MESVVEKITERFHDGDLSPPVRAVKSNCHRLFGREKPLHKVLGGGKCMNLCSIYLNTFVRSSLNRAVRVFF